MKAIRTSKDLEQIIVVLELFWIMINFTRRFFVADIPFAVTMATDMSMGNANIIATVTGMYRSCDAIPST
jgi:hypothetical protein